VWGKSQDTLFGLSCDTGWPVWYTKGAKGYCNVKFRGILVHCRLTSSCCDPRTCCSAIYLQDKRKRNTLKPGISDHTAQQSMFFTAFEASFSFLSTCLQEAEAFSCMSFSVSPAYIYVCVSPNSSSQWVRIPKDDGEVPLYYHLSRQRGG